MFGEVYGNGYRKLGNWLLSNEYMNMAACVTFFSVMGAVSWVNLEMDVITSRDVRELTRKWTPNISRLPETPRLNLDKWLIALSKRLVWEFRKKKVYESKQEVL